MNTNIEEMYPRIGRAALDFVGDDLQGKLLLYAEAEDGVISADILYADRAGNVRLRFAPEPLRDLVYSFWERWKSEPGNSEWRTLSYVIEGGKFKADLLYPDQINPEEDVSERRPQVIKRHFGDLKIDYSNPR